MHYSLPDIKNRVIILMVVFVAVLVLLATKLWAMQIINGPAYTEKASSNRVREASTIAPRGRILDRTGRELVSNRTSMVVLAPARIASDDALVARLAKVLKVTSAEIVEKVSTTKEGALDLRIIAHDVSMQTVAYIAEHSTDFPDIEVDARAVRTYPNGKVAAHLLGYTGEISDKDLNSTDFEGYNPSDIVGKTGAERSFESVLQGVRGRQKLEVDASGTPHRIIDETPPEPGQDIKLTIDLKVQKATEKALWEGILAAREGGYKATAGSAVAIDIATGEVLSLANYPTYDPEEFIGGITQAEWKSLNTKSSNYPLTNRAVSSMYPPASTFKAFVGMAGLQNGTITPVTTFTCTGRWKGMGEAWSKWCWNHAGHGAMNLRTAMAQSCDTFFYETGYKFYKQQKEFEQKFVRQWGYGSVTGIDLPGESKGRVPDATWKREWNENYPEYQRWLPGDTVNMSIGQGDLLSTPLQVVSSYSGIANDGQVMQPHVLKSVLDSKGKAVITAQPKVAFKPTVSKGIVSTMQSDLRGVITAGTAQRVFSGFNVPVAGKTGTAQMAGQDDYAWFVGYAPANNPKYAVCVMIEQGGSGGGYAAPAVRQIFASLFNVQSSFKSTTDHSR